MNTPAALVVVRWLIWDTFRQSLAWRIFWVMLGVSGLAVVFCLSVGLVDLPARPVGEPAERIPAEQAKKGDGGVDVIQGEITFLFGAVRVPWRTYRDDAVRWLELMLAGFVADTVGVLFALIWTAAFLPGFLEPSAVTVLLAKPVPRWSLLAGKYVGVLVFVAFQAVVFVGGTWLALAVRTGVWAPHYLWCVPLLVLHFAVFFSFSTLLAVWTRSTVVCVFGSLVFWLLCWGMNYGRHAALAVLAQQSHLTGSFSGTVELGYWLLPKPVDLGIVLGKLLGADAYVAQVVAFQVVERQGWLHLELSLVSSVLFAVVVLAMAAYEFVKADY
jgi:hypothetical protein